MMGIAISKIVTLQLYLNYCKKLILNFDIF